MRDPVERFWEKVDRTGDCWLWVAGTTTRGYGRFRVEGKLVYPHRFAYELLVGKIPDGTTLDHRYSCPKRCVNPAHLRPATPREQNENHNGPSSKNTSGVRGVSWSKKKKKWRAQVRGNGGKQLLVGWFDGPPPPAKAPPDAEAAVIAKRLVLHTRNDWDRDGQARHPDLG